VTLSFMRFNVIVMALIISENILFTTVHLLFNGPNVVNLLSVVLYVGIIAVKS